MSSAITQQKFLLPEISQSLPTFRQVGNYMNSISSVSTIFLQRDNTHTRLQSQLKINSKKPSLDFQISSGNNQKGESDILSYSHSSSLILFQDSLLYLQRLISLMSSKDHLQNHISQSLAIGGYNNQISKSIAKKITQSFSQYIFMAAKIDFKVLREELSSNALKAQIQKKQIISLKQENLLLYKQVTKLQQQRVLYRQKIATLKGKNKISEQNFMIFNIFKDQYNQITQKISNFQSQLLEKFVGLQNSLIKVTNLRNQLLKKQFQDFELEQNKKNNKQNIKFAQTSQSTPVQRSAMKEMNFNNQSPNNEGQNFKQLLTAKDEIIIELNNKIADLDQQVRQQKELYQQLLDKNISLEKDLFILQTKFKHNSQSSESFYVVERIQEISNISDQISETGYIRVEQQPIL